MDKELKIELLKAMDKVICDIVGDEDLWESWICCGVPDCASEDDYEWIASNKEEFHDVVKLFTRLVKEAE